MVSHCKCLGVRFFVPKVGSQSGTMFLQISIRQMLVSDKKGQGPKAQLSPSRVLVLGKRRQISAGGSRRARSPDSAQLVLGPQATHSMVAQAGLADHDPGRLLLLLLHRDRQVQRFTAASGLGRGQGWPWWGLWSPTGNRFRPVPWDPAHPLSQGQETGWRAPRKRPGSPLTSLPTC